MGNNYQHQITYKIDFSDSVNLSYLDRISVKDESDNVLFIIIKDLMFQNFERGQIHSFQGKPYEIVGFEQANKVLRVKAASTNATNIIFYKPVQSLKIGKNRLPIEGTSIQFNWNHPISDQSLGLAFDGFETQVSVKVNKWHAFYRYSIYDCTSYDAKPECERKYDNGRVLKVSFHFLKKKEYLERKDDIRKSLQILLYEAMQSVFPHHAQYLIVSSLGNGDDQLPWIFNQFECDDHDEESTLSFYFTEDAHIDLGLIGALANKDHFGADYLFRYIYDYLVWLTEGEPVPSGEYDECLYDSNQDKFAFLKYGRESLPSYFDVNLLINFIRDFFCETQGNVLQGVTERNNQQDVFGVCDFCRKKMKNSEMQRLSDGRMRCPDCSVDAVDTLPQFNSLCDVAKNLFKEHLNINFDTITYQAKLVPAVELHRAYGTPLPITNGYDKRNLVGMASSDDIFYVEDGYKPLDTLGTIVHEMTHIWQYHAPEFAPFKSDPNWVEGLAVWTDLFLTEKYGCTDTENKRASWMSLNNKYGIGLKLIMDLCPDDPYGYIATHQKP
jgi:hypothetical protein